MWFPEFSLKVQTRLNLSYFGHITEKSQLSEEGSKDGKIARKKKGTSNEKDELS